MKKRSLALLWGALFRRICEIQNNLFSGQALALTKDDKFHPVQPEIKSGFIALLAVFHDGGLALIAYVHMREYTHVCDKLTELVDLKQTQHYHSYQSGFKWLTRCPHHGHEAHIAVVGSVEGF